MTALDTAIATLLASRAELLMSAIRAPGSATAGQTTTQAGTSRLSIDIQPGAADTRDGASATANASAQTALSKIARTLDAISRFGGGATPPLTGDAPLWPTAPRPASAFANLSGGLFDHAFSSIASAAAARALSQPAPPLPASVLASALARTVGESGLFYESHLVEWLAGQRPAVSLAAEPQARIDLSAMPPLDIPEQHADSSVVWLDGRASDSARTVTDLREVPDLHPANRTFTPPSNPQQAAALAESVRDAPASALSSAASATPAAAAAPAPQESATQAALLAGVHPSTIPLVRQQLDLLATGQFRWSGEAWPGARLEWEIAPQERDARTPDTTHDADRPWRTRVTLSLPTLGTVDADLVLSGEKLVARINASEHGAARLAADREGFRQQLAAAGIGLAGMSIRAVGESADIDADIRAAAKPVPSPLAHLFRGEGA
ncbi:flagellar hook-length control protein FliK [Caballeronia terrestris]|uniref:Flagellar hook-length control protein FliK n=1 Tax=Caballeronia terrestris TaxID=1226301 RepID=A0A158IQJ1_9BURK|nr:flagellar hook-length control protein FliK [Caballeronia terrestris]SAL58817.1 flagellar hook-length control protein FliK [Caballeronia terrestris]